MHRLRFLFLAVALMTSCSPHTDEEMRPNLLFIITDDQRFDMMGIVRPELKTPTMDQLARSGSRFTHGFVTTPICAASRASFLTGAVERTHEYTFGTPPLAQEWTDNSYPVLLREAGYRTGMVGKFGVNTDIPADSLFDVFEPFAAHPYMRETEDGSIRHLTDITTDRAIAFLQDSTATGPFALTLSYNAPHADDADERQFIWPEITNGLYQDLDLSAPPLSEPSFFQSLPLFLAEESLNRIRWYWRFDTPEKAEQMTKGYYRMISGVDAGISRVMDTLRSSGQLENTVVIFMGDNGYFLGERGYAGKWSPHELSIRVPLIIHDPRPGPSAGLVDEPSLNIDIAPTLLDLAGIPIPASMQGRSLVSLIREDAPEDWRTEFFVEHLFDHPDIPKHEGVRGPRYKYARYFEQDPVYEVLYDLVSDPIEANNLAGEPAMLPVLEDMRLKTDSLVSTYVAQQRITDEAQ